MELTCRRAAKLLETVLATCGLIEIIDWLVFNVTSTQKGQFVPTAGAGNRLSRLRMATSLPTRYNAYYLKLHDNNVAQFTEKHSTYINATTGYLVEWLNDLLALLLRWRLRQYQSDLIHPNFSNTWIRNSLLTMVVVHENMTTVTD